MAQNFWIAIFAWSTCFLVTLLVSLMSAPKAEAELHNLVYGLTKIPHEEVAVVQAAGASRRDCHRGAGVSESAVLVI